MTCTDFYMDIRSTVCIDCKDGDMRMSAEVLVDDFVDALLNSNDNLDCIGRQVKNDLIRRAENAWDESVITDEELAHFKKVLEWIL